MELTLTKEQIQTILWLCYREGEEEVGYAIEEQLNQ
jgi:hypothetical protein